MRFLLFNLLVFLAGSLSVLSQAPLNIFFILLITLPVLFYVLDQSLTENSFSYKFLKITYFGSIFLYGYFFFGLSWISSAFDYREGFEELKFISIFGLPLLLIFLTIPGWLVTAFFWGSRLQSCYAISLGLLVGEYCRSILFTGFPWNLFGHSLAFDDRAMQITAIIGVQSAGFFVILFSLTPILFLKKDTIVSGLTTALILPALIIYGSMRVPEEIKFSDKSFLLIQPNIEQDIKMSGDNISLLVKKYIELSSSRPDVDLIVWPESALPFSLGSNKSIRKFIMESIDGNSKLLTGSIRVDEKNLLKNSSLLINKDGEVVSFYDKIHLVPFGEYIPFQRLLNKYNFLDIVASDDGFSRGLLDDPIATPIGTARLLICYEIIFSNEIIRSKPRPDVLINITNDAWFNDYSGPYQHFDNARFRAIENGLPILRAANTGISAVIDPYGRVLKKIDLKEEGVIFSNLPIRASETVFLKFGDFTLLILFILCILRFRRDLLREYFYEAK
jgi:apolipoprotein N-acyltransferase|tara:strand:- start:293 stop:1804 length:1512 start_codon:yes stop_codon:yes gene_type:complete